ncbi:MAG TPA: hypothetical protein PKV17_10635 [Aquabacterium sp.]|jgi:hypothetical protein|nr:hypothetical protein [Aquabacterium sp.]HRH29222.1 hypothetical protein [Aquabacterium sp.]
MSSTTHQSLLKSLLRASAGAALLAWSAMGQAQINGTNLQLWPQWEGRVSVVLSNPGDARPNPFALAPVMGHGLKIQSLQVLSDYALGGGFRASLGLIRGSTSSPLLPGDEGGLSVRTQQLDLVDPMSLNRYAQDEAQRTVPYVGVGYSDRVIEASGFGAWRFNADLGLISLNSQNIGRITRVFQGEQGVDELVRELRLRPVIKFSVNYAF